MKTQVNKVLQTLLGVLRPCCHADRFECILQRFLGQKFISERDNTGMGWDGLQGGGSQYVPVRSQGTVFEGD